MYKWCFTLSRGANIYAEIKKFLNSMQACSWKGRNEQSLKDGFMGCGLLCLMEVKPLWLSSRTFTHSGEFLKDFPQTAAPSTSLCYKCRRSCPSMAHIVKLSSLSVLYLVRGLICFDMLYNLHMLLVHSCPLFSSLSFSPLSNKCQLFACHICPFSECALLTLSKWNYATALWILHSDWLTEILRCWFITVQGCTRLI